MGRREGLPGKMMGLLRARKHLEQQSFVTFVVVLEWSIGRFMVMPAQSVELLRIQEFPNKIRRVCCYGTVLQEKGQENWGRNEHVSLRVPS